MARERRSEISFLSATGESATRVNADAKVIRINFPGAGAVEFNPDSTTEEVRRQAMYSGFAKRLLDNYAGVVAAAQKEGRDPNDLALEWTQGLIETFNGGEWSEEREAGAPTATLVAEAVLRVLAAGGHEITDELRAKIVAKYAGKDGADARKKATDPADKGATASAVRRAIEEIRHERALKRLGDGAAGTVDSASLLA